MFKLKLAKGLSYAGHGVRASSERPFVEVENKETSDALVATGRFTFIEVLAPAGADNEKPVDKMSEKELDSYAAENAIDLTGLTKKAEKLARIQESLSAGGNLFDEQD